MTITRGFLIKFKKNAEEEEGQGQQGGGWTSAYATIFAGKFGEGNMQMLRNSPHCNNPTKLFLVVFGDMGGQGGEVSQQRPCGAITVPSAEWRQSLNRCQS